MRIALFDLDGTLTDPRVGITRSVNYTLERFGLEVADPDDLVSYIGPPLQDSFVSAGLSRDDAWQAVLAYREYFTDTGIFENAVYQGIAEAVAELRGDGWRLAVATSKPTVFAERILEHFELRAAFDVVAGCELDGFRQHKHEVITYALEQLAVTPSPGFVMIGDREHDILGAKRVGIASVGVTWGYGSVDELTAAGADLRHRRDCRPALCARLNGQLAGGTVSNVDGQYNTSVLE